jgi:hypothetical protein
MITRTGYSKDPNIIPEGIVITWSLDMINLKGGLLSFIRYFEKTMGEDCGDTLWLQKCKNKPTYEDLLYVYIIVCGQLKYRLNYIGYNTGKVEINNGDGISFSRNNGIDITIYKATSYCLKSCSSAKLLFDML